MSPGIPKLLDSLNGPSLAYFITQHLVQDLGAKNALAIFENDEKKYRRESANGDFQCAKLENAQEIPKPCMVVIKPGTDVK